jgi:hypothetical protein
MAEFSIRSDAVDVEQIMRQIRARIREKRGADYTEREIRELANAKLETFLDPSRVRSDLLEQFRLLRSSSPRPNFAFEDSTIYDTHRPLVRSVRRLLNPILKLFFNPNPITEALHIQAQLNTRNAELFGKFEWLHYEIVHNLVVEVTRLGIEVKNMKMKVESASARLDFDERRARALEGSVLYRPSVSRPPREGAPGGETSQPSAAAANGSVAGETAASAERRRRRRRRGEQPHAGVSQPSETEPDSDARVSSAPDDAGGGEPSSSSNEPES